MIRLQEKHTLRVGSTGKRAICFFQKAKNNRQEELFEHRLAGYIFSRKMTEGKLRQGALREKVRHQVWGRKAVRRVWGLHSVATELSNSEHRTASPWCAPWVT